MPTPQRSIFRQAALDHLASPEQLDQLLELMPPPGVRFSASLDLPGLRRRISERWSRPTRRVKTPTVLQMEAVECGAAALAMVLGYYGRVVPLEELRVVCGVGRDGSKASNILKAAHSYGLKAKGYKKDTDALPGLPLPLIAFWNFNHFVVVEGFGPRGVYLNDPAIGRRIVGAEELDRSFTGVVLLFEPADGFVPGGVRASTSSAVRERIEDAGLLLLAALCSLLLLIPGVLIALSAQVLVDDVLLAGRANWLLPLLIGLGFAALLSGGATWLRAWLLLRLQTSLLLRSSGDFAHHLLRLPLAFFTQRYAGDIGARVQLNDRVARLLWSSIVPALFGLLGVVAYALLLIRYDALLAAIGIAGALLNVALLRLLAARQTDARQRLIQDRGQLAGEAYAGIHAIETIKATGMDDQFFERWAGYQAKVINAEQALAFGSQLAGIATWLTASLSTIAIVVLGGWRVMDGVLTPGMLVAFGTLYAAFLAPLSHLARLDGSLQDMLNSIRRLEDVLHYPEAAEAGAGQAVAPSAARLSGTLELREVSFGYSPMEPPLIDRLSLTIQPGKRVALVGGSGSGKSTVAKLVAGLYEPWSGEILIDGRARGAIPRQVLTRSLALVDQDVVLFAGSVRENLTLWNTHIGEAELNSALRDAGMFDEIMARPGGYDALIDEDGRDLSGGQRQRLEIARALAGEPSILVLDEATSALDPMAEQTIDRQLRRRGCTTLIVAHRLSTIRDADEIVVLEQGNVVQRGTHDQLIRLAGPYAELIDRDTLVPAPGDVSMSRRQ